jgi:TonB family protein
VIISSSTPKDSRGETVYEARGKDDADQPAVAGTLLPPVALSQPAPKYPKSMKKARETADVTIRGVLSAAGDVIDATVSESSNPEASASALEAVSRYRFKPATLDGKPVAVRVRFVVRFRLKRGDV